MRSGTGRQRTPGPDFASRNSAYFAVSDFALALAASHSAFVMDVQPIPLQLFMPLQLFFADLHSDIPLQELTPVQWTDAASAATDTVARPELNNIAAAAAIAALDTLLICMIESLNVFENAAVLLLSYKDPANAEIITQLSKLMLYSRSAALPPLCGVPTRTGGGADNLL
jgi:hypothetical protein